LRASFPIGVCSSDERQTERKPCWINLEYLTAESWAEECHGMASPHPTLPLIKYFFFPGLFFSHRVAASCAKREFAWPSAMNMLSTLSRYGNEIDISLFCYETALLGPNCWKLSGRSLTIPVRLPRRFPANHRQL
jgi:hypothetical protein